MQCVHARLHQLAAQSVEERLHIDSPCGAPVALLVSLLPGGEAAHTGDSWAGWHTSVSGSSSDSSSSNSLHTFPLLAAAFTQSDVCAHIFTCNCKLHESIRAAGNPYCVPPQEDSVALRKAKAVMWQPSPRRERPAAACCACDVPQVEEVRKSEGGSGSGSEGGDEDVGVDVEVLPYIRGCCFYALSSAHASEENWQLPSTGSSKASGGRKQHKGRRHSHLRQQPSYSSSRVSCSMPSLCAGTAFLAVVFAVICAFALAGSAGGVASTTLADSSGMPNGYGKPYRLPSSHAVVSHNATCIWQLQPWYDCFAVFGVSGISAANSAVLQACCALLVTVSSLLAVVGNVCTCAWLSQSGFCQMWPAVVFGWWNDFALWLALAGPV